MTNLCASWISLDLAFALLIRIKISLFSLFANSIMDSVAQKSTWEGDIGIITRSAISIAGLPSASILGGVSIITKSDFSFSDLASYWAPQRLAVLNWIVFLFLSFSFLVRNHLPKLPWGSVSSNVVDKLFFRE